MLGRFTNVVGIKFGRKAKKYSDSESGIATLEFALIFPVFLVLFYGIAEIINYSMIKRRAKMAVDFGVEFISRDDNNSLTGVERMNALDIWAIMNPNANLATDLRAGRRAAGYTRAFAGVQFTPTPAGCVGAACDFEPDVIWTFYWGHGSWADNPVRISCTLDVVPNSVKLDGSKIPEGMLGRGAVIMGDYTFRYVPLLKNKFLEEQDIHVSAIRKTRGDKAVQHPGHNC